VGGPLLIRLPPARIAEGAARKSHPYRTRWKHATVGKARWDIGRRKAKAILTSSAPAKSTAESNVNERNGHESEKGAQAPRQD
jgi:hypothetical protein